MKYLLSVKVTVKHVMSDIMSLGGDQSIISKPKLIS